MTFLLFFGIVFLIVTCTTRVSKHNKTFVLVALVGLPVCVISGSFCGIAFADSAFCAVQPDYGSVTGHEMAYWRHQKEEIDTTEHVWPLQPPAGPMGAGKPHRPSL